MRFVVSYQSNTEYILSLAKEVLKHADTLKNINNPEAQAAYGRETENRISLVRAWNMITFRKLIGNVNVTKIPDRQSPLELWFERIIDVPIEELSVEELCRAVRQELFINQLMPKVLEVLPEEPLADEYNDGEVIAPLSTIKEKNLKDQKGTFIK